MRRSYARGNWKVQRHPMKRSQPEGRTQTEGSDDVPGTIHTGEAQPESEQVSMYVPHMKSVGGNAECNDEREEEVDGDTKYGMFRNMTARHVW